MDTQYSEAFNMESFMLEVLKKTGYVEHVLMSDVLDDVTKDTLIDIMTSPKTFIIDDYLGICYKNDNGDLVSCPNYGLSVSADGKWLSDKIPDVPYDIEQNGNLRKAEEAQAAYIICIIALVLNDDSFKREIKELINNYDFISMSPIKEGGPTMKSLLSDVLDTNSVIINVIVSAAKYKMASLKKDSEKFLNENLQENEIAELRNLGNIISSIYSRYSKGVLSPANVKLLSKLEILNHIGERDNEIAKLIASAGNAGIIYRIINISTEYISPIQKRRIYQLAEDSVSDLFKEDKRFEVRFGERKQLIDKWRRRYLRIARLSKRKEVLDKFISNRNEFNFPPKL